MRERRKYWGNIYETETLPYLHSTWLNAVSTACGDAETIHLKDLP